MGEKTKYKFSIRKKLVVGITSLAFITYGSSAVVIFFLSDWLQSNFSLSYESVVSFTLVKGVFWTILLCYFGARFITKPLQELEGAAKKAAEGNISEDIEVSKSDDELRAVGLAFNKMLHSLRSMVQDIEDNFEKTNKTVTVIQEATKAASLNAKRVNRTIQEIAGGAETSASSIEQTAQSMEDVTTFAKQVQEHANTSKQSSTEMVNTLTESKEVIESLVSGIKQLANDNEQSLQAVGRLNDQAKKVEEIISLVGDIAEQTNLLALNASIEAARAGEHGKGFAVVADEVRKLADESSKAVQGITELIHNIQTEVVKVVKQITDQVSVANEQSVKGTATNEAIGEMEKSVHEVNSVITEIAGLVDNQLKAILETTKQTQEVAAFSEETSAGATEMTATTEEQTALILEVADTANQLSAQANKLKITIEKFSIQ
ncbi:methyl-accepting chemotaxis protein [Alkalihalobacterium bogoriense]|uniref:methyl-accepting chemotaxis protein n=1 Tax=Alkalihalobacterium bogoriense TaxID=246272 RepID=UPI000479ABF6|nr:methyl-accepting chemotaxis protein [Alkalihalobacterium bogoriense]